MSPLNAKSVRTIYRKEIVDTLRDRRTLATMLLVPMVGYPIALLVTSETIAVQQQESEAREARVVVIGELPRPAIEALENAEGIGVRAFGLETATASTASVAHSYLEADDADVVVVPAPGALAALEGTGTAELDLFYDSTQSFAPAALERVEEALSAYGVAVRDERMRRLEVPPATARPLRLDRRSIASETDLGNAVASSTLPALVLLFIAISCFYPAVDLTAGEKERKTLATLLTAPIRALDIVVGKYLAVVTVGTLAGSLNVIVLGLTLLRVLGSASEHTRASVELSPGAILGLLGCVLLIALPVAALMLLVATLARSFRDASNLLTPVLLLATAPAVLASLPGFEMRAGLASIPLMNAALLMKALILGKAVASHALVTVASTLAATGVLLWFAGRVFTDERVLFSTDGRRADLRAVVTAPPPPAMSTALALAAVAFVANYYGGLAAIPTSPLAGVAITQLLAHVVPAVLLAMWMRRTIAPAELLALGAPAPRYVVAALLIGAAAWLGVSLPSAWLTSALIPGQEKAAEAFKLLLGLDHVAFPLAVLVFAAVPAVAEELIFRGAMLQIFARSLKPATAVVAQALLFGAMHGSVFRLLPTAALGAILGVIALRARSIWPGVLAHAMTNATLLAIDRYGGETAGAYLSEPTPLALGGLGVVALALLIARR